MPEKIGRNDPCPCGSGKKYKNCCMGKDGRKLAELLDRVAEWILEQPDMKKEFEKVLEKYSKGGAVTDVMANNLMDAFIFDYNLPDGKTPFRRFLDDAKPGPVYEGFESNIFSMFEVLEISRGWGLRLRDLVWDREYFVREERGTYQLLPGDILLCRIIPFGSHFIVSTPAPDLLRQDTYLIKRELRYMRPELQKGMNAFDSIEAVWRSEEEEISDNLPEIKKALKKKLDSMGIKVDFRGLDRRINESGDVMEAFPEICEFDFPSMDDFRETMKILRLLWNRYPRKEFGGKTPEEVSSTGPRERSLVSALLHETMRNVDPDDYPSIEEAEKAANRFRDAWLKTPQEELDGKTPAEVILEEREGMGNPKKDFTYRVKIDSVPDYDVNKAKRIYMEGVQALEQGGFIKGAELFKEVTDMYPENYRAWGNLGCCFAYLGNKEKAIKCYETALSIEPDYELARESLEWVKGRTEKELVAEGMLVIMQALKDSQEERRRRKSSL